MGSRNERTGATGLAHLFEHLMFQGSTHVASGEHLSAVQNAGGACNATTWFDRTNYFETVPTGALDLALWFEADRMNGLLDALTQDNLDNQRDVVKEEKRQRYDNAPYGDLLPRLLGLAYPAGHPYAHPVIGSMEDLDAASLEDVRSFFNQWYSPDNAVVTLAGDIEPEDGFARVARYFEQTQARPRTSPKAPAELPSHADRPHSQMSGAVPASLLTLSWRVPAGHSRTSDAVDIALDILGGSETSRLHRRLVRHEGLCASVGSSAMNLAWGNSMALTQAQSLDEQSLDRIEEVICEEIDLFCADGPTPEELGRVRIQFEREWLGQCARVESRADLISASTIIDHDPQRLNTRIEQVCSITSDEIAAAAASYLRTDQRAALTYRRQTPGEMNS